jgi:hypothetical protein
MLFSFRKIVSLLLPWGRELATSPKRSVTSANSGVQPVLLQYLLGGQLKGDQFIQSIPESPPHLI